jgi:chemotaxis protein methyltransferase CheR
MPGAPRQVSHRSRPLASWQDETVLQDVVTPATPVKLAPAPVAARTQAQPEPPPDRATLLQRARALADRGDLEEARRLGEATLRTERLDPDAYLLLAAICQELGDLEAALAALRRALYLAPDSALAHFLLGSLLFRRGERKQGRRSMEAVVTLLSAAPRDDALPGGDGFTAGRLLDAACGYLAVTHQPSAHARTGGEGWKEFAGGRRRANG